MSNPPFRASSSPTIPLAKPRERERTFSGLSSLTVDIPPPSPQVNSSGSASSQSPYSSSIANGRRSPRSTSFVGFTSSSDRERDASALDPTSPHLHTTSTRHALSRQASMANLLLTPSDRKLSSSSVGSSVGLGYGDEQYGYGHGLGLGHGNGNVNANGQGFGYNGTSGHASPIQLASGSRSPSYTSLYSQAQQGGGGGGPSRTPSNANLYQTSYPPGYFNTPNPNGNGNGNGNNPNNISLSSPSPSPSSYNQHQLQLQQQNMQGQGLSIAGDRAAFLRRYASGRRKKAVLMGMRFGWVVGVVWLEVGEFFSSVSSCAWPDSKLLASSSALSSSSDPALSPTHILLLSDPQIPHSYLSYPDTSPIVAFLRRIMTDLYLRKAWNVAMRMGRIDGVIIAGNMMDHGRAAFGSDEYETYRNRFERMFRTPEGVAMYTVPGNLDVGLGPNRMFSPYAKERYASSFSPPNALLPIANHTFILLDSISLVEEDYRRYAAEVQLGEWDGVRGGVIEFVKSFGEDPPPGPTVLISHIPLARPEQSTCGPRRENGRILKGAGIGYQNLLGSETTRFLLENLQPSIIFSGDDHDYCEYMHPAGVREVTLKTFSSAFEVSRPGFQLLSLISPPDSYYDYESPPGVTHADSLCLLPDQNAIYTKRYVPLIILTIAILFYMNTKLAMSRMASAPFALSKPKISPSTSRKSSQTIQATTSSSGDRTPIMRPASRNGNLAPFAVRRAMSKSAPSTPLGSPRMEAFQFANNNDDDVEGGLSNGVANNDGLYMTTPGVRSRAVSHHVGQGDARPSFSDEPGSYFLPLPEASPYSSSGIGLGTPGGMTPGSRRPTMNTRRVTRAPSDWQSAARAKDMTVVELMWDTGQGSVRKWFGRQQLMAVGRFMGGRQGILASTITDIVHLAGPAIVVWFVINAMYFV